MVQMNQDILKEVLYYEQLSFATLLLVHAVAFLLGAIHSLGPGHGKSLMAAYLIGSKGRIRDALILSLSLALSHVFSVIVIGLLALWLTDFFLPGKISKWMGLLSGIGILIIGCWLLISRYKTLNQKKTVNKESGHQHNKKRISKHSSAPLSSLSQHLQLNNHAPDDSFDNHNNHHHHHHHFQSNLSTWNNIALGISGGIVPCPKAIVILLLALSLHKITLGITIILAFSLGISIVLVALGIIMVKASHLLKGRFEGKAIQIIPIIGSLVIIGLGILIIIRTMMIL